MDTNNYPKSISFKVISPEGMTEDARKWFRRLREEVKMTMLAENILRIEYPSDVVSEIKVLNVDDSIFRLNFVDPEKKFNLLNCIFPYVPWNLNEEFFKDRFRKLKRTDSEGVLILEYPPAKKKYHVSVRWDVAYVDDIEASSEEEAVEIAKQKALEAPSSDWAWLEQTDVEAYEITT